MKLDITYTMLGLHGQIEMTNGSIRPITNGSIRPITSATFPRRVFVAIAARARPLQQQEEEASAIHKRTLRNASPLTIIITIVINLMSFNFSYIIF